MKYVVEYGFGPQIKEFTNRAKAFLFMSNLINGGYFNIRFTVIDKGVG